MQDYIKDYIKDDDKQWYCTLFVTDVLIMKKNRQVYYKKCTENSVEKMPDTVILRLIQGVRKKTCLGARY